MDARLAQTLHAEQDDLEAGRFGGVGTAGHAAGEVVADGDHLLGPVTRQRFDCPGGDAALLGGPLGRLGYAILFTQHVGLDLVEAHRVSLDVLLVVRALGDPHVDDGELQRRVGVGEHRDPLVGMDGAGVVHFGTDVHLLEADLAPEEEQPARQLPAKTPRRGLGVASPHHHHVAVLGDVVHDVVGRVHHAHQTLAPDVPGAPVPALPAVRVTHLLGKAAHLVEEQGGATMRGMDELAFTVAVALHQDGQRTVVLVHALDLGRDEVGGLVPGDAHVLALAPILRVALPVGVPVDPLEGVLDPVG